MFQINQQIEQWKTVDFNTILYVQQYDYNSKSTLSLANTVIDTYYT